MPLIIWGHLTTLTIPLEIYTCQNAYVMFPITCFFNIAFERERLGERERGEKEAKNKNSHLFPL